MTHREAIQLLRLALEVGLLDLDALTEALAALKPGRPIEAEALATVSGLALPSVVRLAHLIRHRRPVPAHRWQSLQTRLAQRRAKRYGDDAPPIAPAYNTPRYRLGEEVGRGGSGLVVLAYDRFLGRTVALKMPLEHKRDAVHLERFLDEAQATGRLEHPNIVPVYDLGVLSGGEPFYSMKYAGQNSLRRVLHFLKYKRPETVQTYTLTRLLAIFNQVCMAIDYAHAQGVIHRDLKPENVLLGDHGEVRVMDWGIAQVVEPGDDPSAEVRSEVIVGTPEYMAPEQAMGAGRFPAVDIYALGVILYEILCLSPPFESEDPVETLLMVVRDVPVPPSKRAEAHARKVPARLEAICLRALSKDPAKRHPSAMALRDAIEGYLEGRRDRSRMVERAAERVKAGALAAQRYVRLVDGLKLRAERLDHARYTFEGWEPIDDKASVLEAEAQVEALRNDAVRAFGEAEACYLQALAHDQEDTRAREGLCKLYWQRLLQAEADHDTQATLHYRALAKRFDNGTLAEALRGDGILTLRTVPPGARTVVYALAEHGLTLEPHALALETVTPVERAPLPMGRYCAEVFYPDAAPTVASFAIERLQEVELELRLYSGPAMPEGFVYIPSGPAKIGGDPRAESPLPARDAYISGFCIARFPVTLGEYLSFIQDLDRIDPELAIYHMPRTKGAGLLCGQTPDGLYAPVNTLITGDTLARHPPESDPAWQLPVFGVSLLNAEAYAAWRSDRDNRLYRLPTELEWEKAARGGDGRFFPWGDRFDPTLCKMARARPEPAQPEPIGTFPQDRSPFGVRDLAGGVQEWTSDPFARPGPSFERRLREDPEMRTFERVCRGGSWSSSVNTCRAASRTPRLPTSREPDLGFRLVIDV